MATQNLTGESAARKPDLPIVLDLWAYNTPNSGVDDLGIPDRAADLIMEMYGALEALLASHRQGRGQCCAAADRGFDALAKARGEQA